MMSYSSLFYYITKCGKVQWAREKESVQINTRIHNTILDELNRAQIP